MCKSVKLQLLLVIKDDKEDRDSSLLCQEGEEPTRLAVINLIVVDHSQRPGDDFTTYKCDFHLDRLASISADSPTTA